ncbi:excinuclease Cho [Pseudoduganella flava]|uniref:Excinuclease cho n=1 Tax=Pseudoduganella flava TaxID=871742 RepID=A0A562PJG9_9BURK|nr:endonuclease [Pseudoduganella flava]QGZ42046.1 endonuclease [Pseudoduganella flava]TWI44473.1 excinuclease Cho [Pseudoduganella flava]
MRTHVNSVGLLVCADPVLQFSYPDHIPRDCIDALPSHPGVYLFRDEAGTPIYIGKSVNIRHRVLSHLRTPEESQMLGRTRRIDFERTGGELGALLREAMLIREHQPVFNSKLRRQRDMCSIAVRAHRPEIVFAKEVDFGRTDGLFGLFGTRKAALETLRDIAQVANLCAVMTGIEKGSPGRPCFARQIARCRGACTGEESAADHGDRLAGALDHMRVHRWPYDGPIAIVEESGGLRQKQLVDNWCYLGTAKPRRKQVARFDFDVYQILKRPLLAGGLTIEPL